MRILQISTYDIESGAARAAYRLHKGLRQLGQDCYMVVRYKSSADESVLEVTAKNMAKKLSENFFLDGVIQGHYLDAHRTELSNTIFSLAYPGYELSALPIVEGADIINLHWVARYQSPLTLHRLFSLKKPIVWTLHDQWPFTGGCHYTAGCDKFKKNCVDCPQLADDPFNLPAVVLKDKLEYFKNANLTIVTPSRWLAACAKESKLFRGRRIEVIPNSLETDLFRPLLKSRAKTELGLKADMITILFGANDGKEKRKGFHALLEAIKYCSTDSRFKQLVAADRVKVMCFGYPNDDLAAAGVPVVALGYLGSDEKIRLAYAAADMFILPSLEDNLPNTMLEAMSCGTPVVGFDVGGIPDMVKNGATGYLVPLGDVHQLGETILSLIFETERLEVMGQNCRQTIEEGYTLAIQARRYMTLYETLCQLNTLPRRTGPDPSISSIQSKNPARVSGTIERSAYLETKVGPYFQSISEQVLFKSLKEFASYAQKERQVSEADSAARLRAIQELGLKLDTSDANSAARLEVIHELGQRVGASEADSAARLRAIQELGLKLDTSEANSAARLEVIHELGQRVSASEAESAARLQAIQELGLELDVSEANGAARLEAIQELGLRLDASEANSAARLRVIQELGQKLEVCEGDNAARLRAIEDLGLRLDVSRAESAARLEATQELGLRLDASEANSAARLRVIQELGQKLEACEGDNAARLRAIEDLGLRLDASEANSAARLRVIQELGQKLEVCEGDNAARLRAIEDLGLRLDVSRAESAARLEAIQELGLRLDASEVNSAARLEVIHELGRRLGASEAERVARLQSIEVLGEKLRLSEADLAASLAVIERQKEEMSSRAEELERLRNSLELIKSSRSWRVTAPLRWLHAKLSTFFYR